VVTVIPISGLVLAILGFAAKSGLLDGRWSELLLTLAAVVFVTATGTIVVTAVLTTFFQVAENLVAPVELPGLDRISAILEEMQAERERGYVVPARSAAERQRTAAERRALEELQGRIRLD